MIERSREEAVEKAVANEAMKDNTKAIEKLTQKFEQFTTAITTRVDDAHNRIVKIEDKLERLITNDK